MSDRPHVLSVVGHAVMDHSYAAGVLRRKADSLERTGNPETSAMLREAADALLRDAGDDVQTRLRRWATERVQTGTRSSVATALLLEAAATVDFLTAERKADRAEIERQQEMWTAQSRMIRALAAEVPDDVRARVLAPFAESAGEG